MADVAARTLDGAEVAERSWFDVLRRDLRTWLFLIPAVAFFVGYQAYPIVRVVWISFTDYQYLTNEPANLVGFDNYIAALNDPFDVGEPVAATLFT